MDKIYSRKRIKIPKVEGFYLNKNAKKIFSIFVVLITTCVTFYSVFVSINPIFEGLSIEKAREIGTKIINESSNKVLDNMDYGNIVEVENSNNNNILKTDVKIINKIASEIALEVEKQFQKLENETIKIPVGALTGNKYLTAIGPNIDIKIIPVGSIETQIKNEFEAKGINQTAYRIYLELTCKISVVTRYKTINEKIVNQVLLVETVVVGNVPGAYYNLEGINENDALEILH
ncbi:MAG: sporulation protein YunB [Clostridia bacterium]|nr:sporulation protein YunB [Clostridia bacterium]